MAQPGGASRLQKLLKLIDDGSSLETRKAAAAQIAGIVVNHPAQLPAVLREVSQHLRHKEWDARIAAAHCLGLIAEHSEHCTPARLALAASSGPEALTADRPEGSGSAGSGGGGVPAPLTFDAFSVEQVLDQGTQLLASGGEEYDGDADAGGMSRADGLALQRANLKKRLGLGGAADSFVDTADMFGDEDLVFRPTTGGKQQHPGQQPGQGAGKKEAAELLADMSGMSARERAAALRRAKSAKRAQSGAAAAPGAKRPRAVDGTAEAAGVETEAMEAEWEAALAGRWPFQPLCDQLSVDLLHPVWEVRHGAALGLREVLRSQAAAAGVHAPVAEVAGGWSAAGGAGPLALGAVSASAAAAAAADNAAWLEDCAVHMLCTLALDRFGDFVSDQVVAPVRDTAAQALGAAARPLQRPVVGRLVSALHALTSCGNWEARHGGLLGLKYVLAARDEVGPELLAAALPAATEGLRDKDDDVRAAAAEALLPAAALLAADPSPEAHQVRSLLWDALLTLEDLSPATAGVMSLLARLYSSAGAAAAGSAESLARLVPRLWPFLRHPLTSVRLAAVRCVCALLEAHPAGLLLPGAELRWAARLLFQNLLAEKDDAVFGRSCDAWQSLVRRAPPADLAAALSPEVLAALFALASTQPHRALDRRLLVVPSRPAAAAAAAAQGSHPAPAPVVEADGDAAGTTRMRLAAARALGQLGHALAALAQPGENPVVPHVLSAMRGDSAASRLLAGCATAYWSQEASAGRTNNPLQPSEAADLQKLAAAALEGLAAPALPAELAPLAQQVRAHASALASRAARAGAPLSMPAPMESLGAEGALALAAQVPPGAGCELELTAQALQSSAALLRTAESVLRTTMGAALAAAVVAVGQLPAKLNSVIQPLVGAVRREPQPALQGEAARALAQLAVRCVARTPSPTDKIVANVCGFACGDPAAVPDASRPPPLVEEEGEAERGGATAQAKKAAAAAAAVAAEDPSALAAALARKGGEATLRALARAGGARLLHTLPGLWTHITAPLAAPPQPAEPLEAQQVAVNALRVLGVLAPALHPDVVPAALRLLPALGSCLAHPNRALKLAAAEALAALAAAHLEAVMPAALRLVTPMMGAGAADEARLGGVVALREVVGSLGLALVPYVQLAVVPLLGRMSDPTPATRAVASRCFASVVALMPLAHGAPPPAGLDAEQEAAMRREGGFLQQLLDNRRAEDFPLPFALRSAALRRYQQEGINWLAFLRRFGLHGVLADDMGLGKTLQATCIMAAATHEQRAKHAATLADADRPRPSLIVCPATLVAHWPHEIAKFVAPEVLRPLQYHGPPSARAALRPRLAAHDVAVMSYEAMRADIEWVAGVQWAYCVLDEGHAIRNPASRVAQAARRVDAQHRLILSGTPIQNSVLELWALFDFLMPGFLGGRRAFVERYGRALDASRSARSGSAEAEAGVLALEALHRQVMPFVLRRTKDQVLADLPPKTVQDVVCDPSPLQRALYEDFAASQAGALGQVAGEAASASSPPPHVFQALHYLRRLCSHPLMVLDPQVPAHRAALDKVLGATLAADWPAAQRHLATHLEHAPKLAALRELLVDCGIASDAGGGEKAAAQALGGGGAAEDAGHRALVFAQSKELLDLVERCVLAPLGVTSLRIDGGVDPAERFRRVQRFNADPTLDVMLLTTAVGGLGLNLTAADTVVFLEHDWNPQRDLQAMDRAHRLGQRRAVNVYRLLVRGTLEEQIMSLQRFKLDVAAAVVNADNVSMAAMDTGNLLELFTLQEEGRPAAAAGPEVAAEAAAGSQRGGLAAVLEGLTDPAATEAQYGEEFDLEAFKQRLMGKKG